MLKALELNGFKSFAKKTKLTFDTQIAAIVGPNGSGKSNVAESLRWVLGEQSMKSLRGKRGEDLIWNGYKTSPRSNRASVTITFDNTARRFNVDFDEVIITREVHRDGVNEYSINGSKVRLKDVYELLSQISLGASGHHIISQGEADRILNASAKDRRSMIEDALGLKIFQYKKEESERKLEKTAANIKEAESLRREIAPHLKFLKKQVEQIERLAELKVELTGKLHQYFQHEEWHAERKEKENKGTRERLEKELRVVEAELATAQSVALSPGHVESTQELSGIEQRIHEIRQTIDARARDLGRLEGKLEITDKPDRVVEVLPDGSRRCRYCLQSVVSVDANSSARLEEEKRHIEVEKEKIEREIEGLRRTEEEQNRLRVSVLEKIEKLREGAHAAERALYEKEAVRRDLAGTLARLADTEQQALRKREEIARLKTEMGMVIGRDVLSYTPLGAAPEMESTEDLHRQIERLRIRIEDMGVGGDEVLKEYKDTTERDAFLEKEIHDLATSADSLKLLLADLSKTIEEKFGEGIIKINSQFGIFFGTLFGGGDARLEVVRETKRRSVIEISEDGEEISPVSEEAEPGEWGIGVAVNLPRKKIRSLDMLSGGERALVSIALLFAMSQVNPPPFLVLDETDAALDEANSRKYGDMIETLAKQSQLILITHNRETMSRAHVLYGVTMTADSVSQLLSIKFDDATVYAK